MLNKKTFFTYEVRRKMTSTKCVYLGIVIVGLIGLSSGGALDTSMKVQAQGNMTEMERAGMEEAAQEEHMAGMPTYVVRDSIALNLEGISLPAGGFIHLYDSTPYMIMNGHVAVNVPCEGNSTASIQVLLGQAPNLTAAELENIAELSSPGDLCLYHADIVPGHTEAQGNMSEMTEEIEHDVITDVAIMNPGEEDVEFPPGSTAVVGVNEIMPGAEESHSHGSEAGTNQTDTE
jgi:hypothetical protein